jgi:hypothetical protein
LKRFSDREKKAKEKLRSKKGKRKKAAQSYTGS